MVDLIAQSPTYGMAPVEHGAAVLSEIVPERIQWVAALPGGPVGDLPPPNGTREVDGARWIWAAPDQAFVIGAAAQIPDALVSVDQTDAWCLLSLEGTGARDVLARLAPLDIRDSRFAIGQTARTLVGHMAASLTRVSENTFEIMVFRSMASTAVHELVRAMKGVSARD